MALGRGSQRPAFDCKHARLSCHLAIAELPMPDGNADVVGRPKRTNRQSHCELEITPPSDVSIERSLRQRLSTVILPPCPAIVSGDPVQRYKDDAKVARLLLF